MADLRHLVAALVLGSSLLLTGCGGPPTKAEFVTKMRESVGDLDAGMKSQHIDPKAGDALITKLLECQYDAIKGDDNLLQKTFDNPGDTDIAPQLETKSSKCVDAFSTAMAAAAASTPAPTTTSPESADSSTTAPGG